MRGWRTWALAPGLMAAAVCSTELAAQSPVDTDLCLLASEEEFQTARGIHPTIGFIPGVPVLTEMVWGPHCDYSDGSIDMFSKKSPEAELERVLKLTDGGKQRAQVQGLGKPAFFTTVYPEDPYRRRGLLAISLGDRILTISMDGKTDEPLEATRPKLEGLAKLPPAFCRCAYASSSSVIARSYSSGPVATADRSPVGFSGGSSGAPNSGYTIAVCAYAKPAIVLAQPRTPSFSASLIVVTISTDWSSARTLTSVP